MTSAGRAWPSSSQRRPTRSSTRGAAEVLHGDFHRAAARRRRGCPRSGRSAAIARFGRAASTQLTRWSLRAASFSLRQALGAARPARPTGGRGSRRRGRRRGARRRARPATVRSAPPARASGRRPSARRRAGRARSSSLLGEIGVDGLLEQVGLRAARRWPARENRSSVNVCAVDLLGGLRAEPLRSTCLASVEGAGVGPAVGHREAVVQAARCGACACRRTGCPTGCCSSGWATISTTAATAASAATAAAVA